MLTLRPREIISHLLGRAAHRIASCIAHRIAGFVLLDDGRACTADACNQSTGQVTHTLTCAASATFFCQDKYGRTTRQVVCVQGQSCDASCP